MARPLALGARHRGGSSPLYPTEMVSTTQHSRTRKCKIGIWRNWLAHRSDTAGVESSSLSIPTERVVGYGS